MVHGCLMCFSLKIGSLIVGSITVISSLATLIHTSKVPKVSEQIFDIHDHQYFKRDCIFTFSILTVVWSLMLIVGVIKKNPRLILPILWIGFTQFLIYIPLSIAFITMTFTASGPPKTIFWIYFACVGIPIINGCFLIMIYQYYRELMNGRSQYEPLA